jgi:hypothetical protein
MNRFGTFLALALVGFSASAYHTDVDVQSLPYQHLFDVQSSPGESQDAFVVRIAPQLRAWSDTTKMEACASISVKDGIYAAVVGTSKSHLGCAIYSAKRPEGFAFTGDSIHSHGGNNRFRMNDADRIFQNVSGDARSGYTAVVYGQELSSFSETDLHGAPGYLATINGVMYQDGKGHIRTVQ